jgi:3-oxoacyl-[acyl-carrier protein] reductase
VIFNQIISNSKYDYINGGRNMNGLTGKVAFITGAGNKEGIGCAIALRLAKDGADIVVTDRAPTIPHRAGKPGGAWGLNNLVEEVKTLGRKAFAITADLLDSQQIRSMVKSALDNIGAIDILVNNAALTGSLVGRKPVVDYDEEIWRKQLDINLTAPFLISKLIAKKMIERGKGGKIINIASIRGKVAQFHASGYSASKFGLIGLTQTLALELGPYKINVNAICPGPILSWGGRAAKIHQRVSEGSTMEEAIKQEYSNALPFIPLGRLGTPKEVANVASFLASSESDYMTGQAINLDGGFLLFR